jgi:hypothetical protein
MQYNFIYKANDSIKFMKLPEMYVISIIDKGIPISQRNRYDYRLPKIVKESIDRFYERRQNGATLDSDGSTRGVSFKDIGARASYNPGRENSLEIHAESWDNVMDLISKLLS